LGKSLLVFLELSGNGRSFRAKRSPQWPRISALWGCHWSTSVSLQSENGHYAFEKCQ